MARPLRLEHAGAIWHVTSRGNARQPIVHDDVDRARFVETLGRVVPAVRWRLHAWVLMTNHHHLLVETPEPTLARGMRQLNGVFSQAFNRRWSRVGHVFQGRYKGILVERESHLLELVRYVVLNPVRAGLVQSPADYPWSSYADTAGLRVPVEWLVVDWTLGQFGPGVGEARRRFREFVSEGRGALYKPWDEIRQRGCLGSDAFVESLAGRARAIDISPEVPRTQRLLGPPPSTEALMSEVQKAFRATGAQMVARSRHPARKAFALLARRVADARLADIAQCLGLSGRSASSVIRAAEALERQDSAFRSLVRDTQSRLLRWRSSDDPNHHSET